ncbi:MAG: pyridoxine 5'-phosphate synthase [Burkholderiales bacterium]|nr:pyridoxine 5'-phosphate synthase [Burkholderiales bacterium]
MIELGVNIDHVATVRQARRTHEPDPVWAAVEAHLGGADGITVHLREDRRHIQDDDVRRLRELTQIKLNLEMAATDEMLAIARQLRPEMAMLVPEGRHEITTEGGLDIVAQQSRLADVVAALHEAGIVSSVFIDADLDQVEAAARIGARVCEIHTGPYAHAFHARGRDADATAVRDELQRVRRAGEAVLAQGMRFNAGHALNYYNVQPIAALSGIRELHIGHAIVSRALFVGLREAVREMKRLMTAAAGAVPAASAGSSLGGAPPDGSPPDGSPLDGSPPGGSAASSSGPAPRAQGSRG